MNTKLAQYMIRGLEEILETKDLGSHWGLCAYLSSRSKDAWYNDFHRCPQHRDELVHYIDTFMKVKYNHKGIYISTDHQTWTPKREQLAKDMLLNLQTYYSPPSQEN